SRLARPIDFKSDGRLPILQNAIVIPIHKFADGGAVIYDSASHGPPIISGRRRLLPNINAVYESEFRAKSGAVIGVRAAHDEMAAGVRQIGVERVPLGRCC